MCMQFALFQGHLNALRFGHMIHLCQPDYNQHPEYMLVILLLLKEEAVLNSYDRVHAKYFHYLGGLFPLKEQSFHPNELI